MNGEKKKKQRLVANVHAYEYVNSLEKSHFLKEKITVLPSHWLLRLSNKFRIQVWRCKYRISQKGF